ncbi:MAG: transporter [Myxococcales bacterium]|nr:transporter [Myxococcales bacterium]MDH3483529.1 transporter [Myxococcales bacterium]
MKLWWLVAAFVFPLSSASEASACGTCSVGDPTLTIVGFEQPKAQRVRTSATARHRNDRIGEENVDRLQLSEQRLELAGAYSPTDRWTLSLMMPVVHRYVSAVNLAQADIWAPGDLEFRARAVVYRDRKFAPQHLVGLIGGLEFPTSSVERDAEGIPLPLEFQAGTGSWDPIVGASYTMFSDPWSVYLSSVGLFPTRGTANTKAGISFRQTALGQLQPWKFLAFQVGVELRIDQPGYIAGVRDPNTGGHITYGTLGIVALPHDKILLHITAAVPLIQRLDGAHEEGVGITGGLIYEI